MSILNKKVLMENVEKLYEARNDIKVNVSKKNYKAGKVTNIQVLTNGSVSIGATLTDQDVDTLASLKDGESTRLKVETGDTLNVSRDSDAFVIKWPSKSFGKPVRVSCSDILMENSKLLKEDFPELNRLGNNIKTVFLNKTPKQTFNRYDKGGTLGTGSIKFVPVENVNSKAAIVKAIDELDTANCKGAVFYANDTVLFAFTFDKDYKHFDIYDVTIHEDFRKELSEMMVSSEEVFNAFKKLLPNVDDASIKSAEFYDYNKDKQLMNMIKVGKLYAKMMGTNMRAEIVVATNARKQKAFDRSENRSGATALMNTDQFKDALVKRLKTYKEGKAEGVETFEEFQEYVKKQLPRMIKIGDYVYSLTRSRLEYDRWFDDFKENKWSTPHVEYTLTDDSKKRLKSDIVKIAVEKNIIDQKKASSRDVFVWGEGLWGEGKLNEKDFVPFEITVEYKIGNFTIEPMRFETRDIRDRWM